MNEMTQERKDLQALADRLKTFTVPELCDGAVNPRVMHHQIKPWIGRSKIAGPAVTVDVPSGEGKLVGEVIHQLSEGDILVVSGKGNCEYSYWGDHRSVCASCKKAAGVVIDGAFRDLEGCEEAAFPIFAKGLCCRTAAKTGEGTVQVPVECGGVLVHPGDLVVADVNGVIVLAPKEAEAVMERALKKRVAQEQVMQEMKRTGKVITRILI